MSAPTPVQPTTAAGVDGGEPADRVPLVLRVAPFARAHVRARHVLMRNVVHARKSWPVIASGFFEPVIYLFAIGVGIGDLVDGIDPGDGRRVPYEVYAAPALLAASAMNGAVFESTFNVFFRLHYGRIYAGMLATPVTPMEVALGEIAWSLSRGLLYAVGFVVVMAAFGLTASWWVVLAPVAAVLVGFGFAAVGMACTTWMRSWQDFDLVMLVTLPMFLFSATFYPLSVYPGWLQAVARVSPLYHATELMRALSLGTLDASLVGHVAVFAAMGAVGMRIVDRRLRLILTP